MKDLNDLIVAYMDYRDHAAGLDGPCELACSVLKKVSTAIKLLAEIEPHIDEWNFPIGMKEEIIEFLASAKEGAEK